MQCEHCKKNVAAHFSNQIIDGVSYGLYLCTECYLKLTAENILDAVLEPLFIQNRVSGERERICPACGLSASQVIKTGFVGCEKCYTTFSDILLPYIEQCQGKGTHIARANDGAQVQDGQKAIKGMKEAIAALNEEIRLALKEERFLDADAIKRRRDKLFSEGNNQP